MSQSHWAPRLPCYPHAPLLLLSVCLSDSRSGALERRHAPPPFSIHRPCLLPPLSLSSSHNPITLFPSPAPLHTHTHTLARGLLLPLFCCPSNSTSSSSSSSSHVYQRHHHHHHSYIPRPFPPPAFPASSCQGSSSLPPSGLSYSPLIGASSCPPPPFSDISASFSPPPFLPPFRSLSVNILLAF